MKNNSLSTNSCSSEERRKCPPMPNASRQALLPALLGLVAATVVSVAGAQPIAVSELGSFHIGGSERELRGLPSRQLTFGANSQPITVDPNGQFETGQMYVQYVKLDRPKAKYPLLMWHGGGSTGNVWESKPDGKDGWQSIFLRYGHDVYLSDAVERGRAGWSQFPEIYAGAPFFRTKAELWTIARIGPRWSGNAKTSPTFEGSQFPVEAFDQSFKGGVPRWNVNFEATQKAYDQYVEKVCPCVLLIHSQAGSFAFPAALKRPDLIKAIVAIEPSEVPPATVDPAALAKTPFLFIWGDNLAKNDLWVRLRSNVKTWEDRLLATGAPVTVIDLPDQNIKGNTHAMMFDRNSERIAALIQEWMAKEGLMK